MDRVSRIGLGLLALKEIEYFGRPQVNSLEQRLEGLVNRLLSPCEERWLGGPQLGPVVPRVKALRMKILPEMVQGKLPEDERRRRWDQLADIYLAQQVANYPSDYLVSRPSVDRLLETAERLEEDLTDHVTVHGKLHAIMQVGPAIEVSPQRDRRLATDPLTVRIETELQSMLDQLAVESPLWEHNGDAFEKTDGVGTRPRDALS
jgi:hypothetical protein